MVTIETATKDIQRNFSRREYEQFIVPLIRAYEEKQKVGQSAKVSSTIDNIITSSLTRAKEGVVIIEQEEYIKLESIEEILNTEKRNYTL